MKLLLVRSGLSKSLICKSICCCNVGDLLKLKKVAKRLHKTVLGELQLKKPKRIVVGSLAQQKETNRKLKHCNITGNTRCENLKDFKRYNANTSHNERVKKLTQK